MKLTKHLLPLLLAGILLISASCDSLSNVLPQHSQTDEAETTPSPVTNDPSVQTTSPNDPSATPNPDTNEKPDTDIPDTEKPEDKKSLLAFELTEDQTAYIVVGMGECTDTDVVIPTAYENLPVTAIGEGAFADCASLKSLTVPDSITKIGAGALSGCIRLKTLTLPFIGEHIHDFTSTLTYLFGESIPSDLLNVTVTLQTSIAPNTYQNCAFIRKIEYKSPVGEIGAAAFQGCAALSTLSVSVQEETILSERALENCTSLTQWDIPTGIYSIGSYAFSGCASLTSITIPDTVTAVDKCAFKGCISLSKITIPDSVTQMGAAVFSGCTALSELTIPFVGSCVNPADVHQTTLGYIFGSSDPEKDSKDFDSKEYTTGNSFGYTSQVPFVYWNYNQFYYYAIPTSLRKITITNQTILPANAFRNCDLLKEICITKPLSDLGAYAFSGCAELHTISFTMTADSLIQNYAFANCIALTEMAIPEGTLKIAPYAFSGCFGLTSVTMPESLRTIGKCAFQNCAGLTELVVPKGVTSIGSAAFSGCVGLVNITLPFVGGSANATSSYTALFGYVFGDSDPDSDNQDNTTTVYTTSDESEYTSQTYYVAWGGGKQYYYFKIPKNIRNVTITNQSILPANAFENCDLIKTVTVECPLTIISRYAFSNCKALTVIDYCGTQAEWDSIFLDSNWNRNAGEFTVVVAPEPEAPESTDTPETPQSTDTPE